MTTTAASVLGALFALLSPAPKEPLLLPVPGAVYTEMLPGGRTFSEAYLDGSGAVVGLNRVGEATRFPADVTFDALLIECGGCVKNGGVEVDWGGFDFLFLTFNGNSGQCWKTTQQSPCFSLEGCDTYTSAMVKVDLAGEVEIWSPALNEWVFVWFNNTGHTTYRTITSPRVTECGGREEASYQTIDRYGHADGQYTIWASCSQCPLGPIE